MDKLFLSVLNMSLTGAFVIAAICLARLPLKKAPKIISYALWAVAGFRLVFPFSIESIFSLIPFNSAPIPTDIAMQPVPRIDSGIPFVNNAVSGVLPAPALGDSVNPLQIWTTIGAWVWIIGVAVMLIYGIVSFVVLKRKMMEAAHIEANIYEANNTKSPFVLGVFSPKVYLPVGLSEHERGYILLHEQTHIRRRDHIVKFAAYFILCLHWFNPLAWVAFLLMGADMEMSCDERVMKELGGEISDDYSMSLVRIATGRRILSGSPLAFGEGGMKERVKRVLNFKKPSRVIIVAAIALVAVLSVGFACSRSGSRDLIEFEVIFNDVTEHNRSIQFKHGDTLYTDYIVNGELQNADGTRGLNEVGYALDDFGKYRIFERDGYSINEFIIVQDYGFMNPATIYVGNKMPPIPTTSFQVRKWVDFYLDEELPWTSTYDLMIDELPGVMFSWTSEKVTATDRNGMKELFWGMPVWNVYLADLNGDGLPELCATVSIGSGIVDTRVTVYDYKNDTLYDLSDRAIYDYSLSLENDRLVVTQSRHGTGENLATGSMAITDGQLVVFGIDRILPETQAQETELHDPGPPPNFDKSVDTAIALADYFVEVLNEGRDLTGDDKAMESWNAIFGNATVVQVGDVREVEYSDNLYVFVLTANGQRDVSVCINMQGDEPWYFSPYTRYYPRVQSVLETYLSLISEGDVHKLAGWLSLDGDRSNPAADFIERAERAIKEYEMQDLSSYSYEVYYDDTVPHFLCNIRDANGYKFPIWLVFGDGLIMPEPLQ